MPTYNYKCHDKECNHDFEIRQSIKDDKLKVCPKCNKETLEKVISAPLVQFKGNGWFATTGKY